MVCYIFEGRGKTNLWGAALQPPQWL